MSSAVSSDGTRVGSRGMEGTEEPSPPEQEAPVSASPASAELSFDDVLKAEGRRALGTHVSPPRMFGDADPLRRELALHVECVIPAGGLDVHITRSGGLFVPIPEAMLVDPPKPAP
jgi:hypothetical protein